jgi:hypothetical protein
MMSRQFAKPGSLRGFACRRRGVNTLQIGSLAVNATAYERPHFAPLLCTTAIARLNAEFFRK